MLTSPARTAGTAGSAAPWVAGQDHLSSTEIARVADSAFVVVTGTLDAAAGATLTASIDGLVADAAVRRIVVDLWCVASCDGDGLRTVEALAGRRGEGVVVWGVSFVHVVSAPGNSLFGLDGRRSAGPRRAPPTSARRLHGRRPTA